MRPLLLSALLPLAVAAQSQTVPVSVRLQTTEANSPPGTCGCFWMTGAAADAALPLLPRISAVVDAAGSTASRVPGTNRGLSIVTLLAGPRYTLPMRRAQLHFQALFGAARGFDADFVTGAQRADTATSFAYSVGGAIDLPVTQHIAIRALQAEFLQTDLPNGVDNRQRNIRLGAGIVFRIAMPTSRR